MALTVEFNQPDLQHESVWVVNGDIDIYDGLQEEEVEDDYRVRLYRAALSGDWQGATEIHIDNPRCFVDKISRNGETALHIAAAAGQSNFVKGVLPHLTTTELRSKTDSGNTAFCLAAASGNLDIVREMEAKDSELPDIPGCKEMKPILMAALLGHGNIVNHLMRFFEGLSKQERIDVLISSINTDLYEVALDILRKDQQLAISRNNKNETPLHVLARKTPRKGASQLNTWRQFGNIVAGYLWEEQQEDDAKLRLVKRLWKIVTKQPPKTITAIISYPKPELLFVAIELGNYEFVSILIRHYPDLIWETDDEDRSIFHAAVQFRQEKIYSHIYEIEGINHLLAANETKSCENNILHLAALLPCPDRLNVVSGPALQMQRELLWFQEVEGFTKREFADSKNNPPEPDKEKDTPRALFTKEHRLLRKEGEQWMRETSTQCMVVATLVAGVVFQALFQLPSINNNQELWYWVLVISDGLSLVASTASTLTFLAILTSRYAEEDFLVSLPLKLLIGLMLLYVSIMTMLLAFTAAIAINFPPQSFTIVITVLAGITGTFYVLQHLPLLDDAYHSTFRSNYLFRPQQWLFRDK